MALSRKEMEALRGSGYRGSRSSLMSDLIPTEPGEMKEYYGKSKVDYNKLTQKKMNEATAAMWEDFSRQPVADFDENATRPDQSLTTEFIEMMDKGEDAKNLARSMDILYGKDKDGK